MTVTQQKYTFPPLFPHQPDILEILLLLPEYSDSEIVTFLGKISVDLVTVTVCRKTQS